MLPHLESVGDVFTKQWVVDQEVHRVLHALGADLGANIIEPKQIKHIHAIDAINSNRVMLAKNSHLHKAQT